MANDPCAAPDLMRSKDFKICLPCVKCNRCVNGLFSGYAPLDLPATWTAADRGSKAPRKPRVLRRVYVSSTTTGTVECLEDSERLDELLWQVLWRPLGLPRNIRSSFRLDGESIELVAKDEERITGGLVAVWTRDTEVELRHLAVAPGNHNRGTGRLLVERLVDMVRRKGCRRVHTIARHTSSAFFRKLGFCTAPGIPPDHPHFRRHGIVFELMEKHIEPD